MTVVNTATTAVLLNSPSTTLLLRYLHNSIIQLYGLPFTLLVNHSVAYKVSVSTT